MPDDYQYTDEVQSVLGMNEGPSPVDLILARARIPHTKFATASITNDVSLSYPRW